MSYIAPNNPLEPSYKFASATSIKLDAWWL